MIGIWTMAVMAWLTVISGTYVVYPWYRAPVPDSPRSLLIADAALKAWHTFGMEWKEHVAWFSPILATAAAFLATRYGSNLTQKPHIRRATLVLFTISFVAAAVAGVFGAFINKVGPIR